jgi:hypothetical protein
VQSGGGDDEIDRKRVRVVGGVLRKLNEAVRDEEVEDLAKGCRDHGWSSIELVEQPVMDRAMD